jgi:hypothetical protein
VSGYFEEMRRDPRNAHHLATVSHDGLFWDAYLELEDSQDYPVRGRIAFSAAGDATREPVRTATIFLEDTAQAVLARARDFKTHQLVALLRSCAPEEPPQPAAGSPD